MKRKIGQVSKELGISQRRIIEYEKVGLLKPDRQEQTNDRLFSDFDVRQVRPPLPFGNRFDNCLSSSINCQNSTSLNHNFLSLLFVGVSSLIIF